MNKTKKMTEKRMDTAMKAGVVGVGAESRRDGAFSGNTERSYWGENVGSMQTSGASLLGLEQEPSDPIKTLGPSTA